MQFNRKSNLVLQFIILVVIAAIMIFLVTAFASSLFGAFFPSSDKATIKSFETLYTTIDLKSKDMKAYNSSTITVYLYDDYQVLLFEGASIICNGKRYYRPSKCLDPKKTCICLYDDLPKHDKEDKDENLYTCRVFEAKFQTKAFEVMNTSIEQCQKPGKQQFNSYIIASRYDANNNHEIYVWLNNDDNKKKDREYQTKTCPKNSGICSGKRDGELLIGTAWSDKVKAECQKKDPASTATEGTCFYDTNKNSCDLKCGANVDCSQIIECGDYTSLDMGGTTSGFKYFASSGRAEDYCINDYCKVSNGRSCEKKPFTAFLCKSEFGVHEDTIGLDCHFPDNCGRVMLGSPLSKFVWYYDQTLATCTAQDKSAINNNFYASSYLYTIKEEVKSECQKKMINPVTNLVGLPECELKTGGLFPGQFLLSYKSTTDCKNFVDYCYTQIYHCKGPYYNYEVIGAVLDPGIIASSPDNAAGKTCIMEYINPADLSPNYKCIKGKDVTFKVKVKNTGQESLKSKIIMKPLPLFTTQLLGSESSIAKDGTVEISGTYKLPNVAGIDTMTFSLGAECTEDICQKNPYLKQRFPEYLPPITIKVVDALN